MAPVTIDRAVKAFGGVRVLHEIEIEIEHGEFVVLVGPSGCGKSTLLRLIAGLEDITSGDIVIDGKVVSRLHPKDRDIAMVFQSYALYPHMSVAENMGFSLRMQDAPKAEIDEKVSGAAEILGLTPLMDRYPRQLSGGQRQRVAMGRAIVRDPKVFLFDEPLSNLDAKLRVQMRAEIRELHRKLGATIVYVTHDQIEAMTMADKIVVLRDGRVEQVGRPMDLYNRPANAFVAGFIGSPSMNLLKGRFKESGRVFELAAGGLLAISPALETPPDGEVILGVRPEFVVVGEGDAARIRLVEPTGSEHHVSFVVGSEIVTAIVRGRDDLSDGDDVPIALSAAELHFFDTETGAALIIPEMV